MPPTARSTLIAALVACSCARPASTVPAPLLPVAASAPPQSVPDAPDAPDAPSEPTDPSVTSAGETTFHLDDVHGPVVGIVRAGAHFKLITRGPDVSEVQIDHNPIHYFVKTSEIAEWAVPSPPQRPVVAPLMIDDATVTLRLAPHGRVIANAERANVLIERRDHGAFEVTLTIQESSESGMGIFLHGFVDDDDLRGVVTRSEGFVRLTRDHTLDASAAALMRELAAVGLQPFDAAPPEPPPGTRFYVPQHDASADGGRPATCKEWHVEAPERNAARGPVLSMTLVRPHPKDAAERCGWRYMVARAQPERWTLVAASDWNVTNRVGYVPARASTWYRTRSACEAALVDGSAVPSTTCAE